MCVPENERNKGFYDALDAAKANPQSLIHDFGSEEELHTDPRQASENMSRQFMDVFFPTSWERER